MTMKWTHRMANIPAMRRELEGPFALRVTRQWSVRWMAQVRKRYDRFSRGGGDWAPLAESTLRGRRRSKTAKRAIGRLGRSSLHTAAMRLGTSILRDKGILFRATAIGGSGNLFQQRRLRAGAVARVGFAGSKLHPSGRATLAQIASYHQRGAGHLPRRAILVPPDSSTRAAMQGDAARAYSEMMRRGSLPPGRGGARGGRR